MDARHEEIARCLFREANDALFIFDPKTHRVVDVNPAALRMTGHDKDVALRLRLHDVFESGESEGLDRLMEAYRRTGFFHSREGYSLRRENGPPIPVNLSVSRIHTTPEPLGLVVARDVTERVRAQEVLRESEDRYRGLVEAARVVIWAISPDGVILSLNRVFEAITGWATTEWVGRPFADLVHPDDAAAAADAVASALHDKPVPPREFRVSKRDGGHVVLEMLTTTRQNLGGRPAVSGIARDVTERRQAAEAMRLAESMAAAKDAAEAADSARREFIGNISHEIRTPMTSVLGFTDVLLADERVRALPEELLDNIRTIRLSGHHLLNLINDILDLTRIELGKLRVELSPSSPACVVEDVASTLRPRAEAKGLSLAIVIDPDVPALVRTDPNRLHQVLLNLLTNAIKFTTAGGVVVRVGLARGSLRFEVQDTGVGIPAAEIARLFDPFYTSDSRTTRESGAGLGLAISKRLAELLGGSISVQSRPGQGSTFVFTIPAVAVEPGQEGYALPSGDARGDGEAKPVRHVGGRLLLAEDNDAIRQYVALRLGQSGVEVVTASNGREAVEIALASLASGRPFDWVLMDMQMPVMDGYAATRKLRGLGCQGPIIALTAYAVGEDPDLSQETGCDDHVGKPVDWERLIDVLNRHRGTRHERPAPNARAV